MRLVMGVGGYPVCKDVDSPRACIAAIYSTTDAEDLIYLSDQRIDLKLISYRSPS